MSSEIFEFKQYKIIQNSASVFKVNTEAVLLTAWTQINQNLSHILEVGCGTGVISIGLRQRIQNSTHITAIDINKIAVELTEKNIQLNGIQNITVIHDSMQDFLSQSTKKYDLILSNPPYFETKLKSIKPRDLLAKYTDTLDYETLIKLSSQSLNTEGIISLVIPFSDLKKIQSILIQYKLYITRICHVFTSHKKNALRVLLQIEKTHKNITEESLYIVDLKGNYTNEYKSLTNPYYTIF